MLRIGNLRSQITFLLLSLIVDVGAFYIALKMPRFVEKGQSVILHCDYALTLDELYKVEWRRNGRKIFQFIKERTPPYRNFTVPGGTIDWYESNEKQLKLKDLDFSVSGFFTCLLSMERPIYTKESLPVDLTIIEKQKDDPQIIVRKAAYSVGEVLELNCTSEPARPAPAVTWLLNGKEVDYRFVKTFQHGQHQGDEHLASSTTQLTLEILEKHIGPSGFIELTCLSTIPAYLDDDDETFADKRVQSISIEVYQIPTTTAEATSKSPGPAHKVIAHVLRLLCLGILLE